VEVEIEACTKCSIEKL